MGITVPRKSHWRFRLKFRLAIDIEQRAALARSEFHIRGTCRARISRDHRRFLSREARRRHEQRLRAKNPGLFEQNATVPRSPTPGTRVRELSDAVVSLPSEFLLFSAGGTRRIHLGTHGELSRNFASIPRIAGSSARRRQTFFSERPRGYFWPRYSRHYRGRRASVREIHGTDICEFEDSNSDRSGDLRFSGVSGEIDGVGYSEEYATIALVVLVRAFLLLKV